MGLYRVDLRVSLVVVADDELEAIVCGLQNAMSEAENVGFDLDGVDEVKRVEDLPDEWRRSIPWGGGAQDRTCSQILAEDK